MKKTLMYAAHRPMIQLPPQNTVEPSDVQYSAIPEAALPLRTKETRAAITQAVTPMASVIASHQQFVQNQAQMYQYFLHCVAQLPNQLGAPSPLPVSVQQEETLSPTTEHLPDSYRDTYPGPSFSRQQLEILAGGKISSIFGEAFAEQDDYELQVRMPEPPLLLADRVLGIEGEAKSLTTGTIWTETDVTEGAWYLHQEHMPAGIIIESGQADLLLISWLGIDFHNRGERAYRLLGCEATFFGELPKVGETLHFDIHVDGHSQLGDVRLFFFHYDCYVNGRLLLQVRNGQAGFFSRKELDESQGVIWAAETADYDKHAQLDAPLVACQYQQFNRQQLEAFSNGNAYACFGPGYELLQTHTRTPRIANGNLLFIDEITAFDVNGGPWQRGYMRGIQKVKPDDWYFNGHFKNDPCMPGTLMLDVSYQVMAIYLTALGYTLDKDGWRFEPIPEMTCLLRCRGQVIPTSKQVSYEIFVEKIVVGPIPMLVVDLLGKVDGLNCLHSKLGLRLVPSWPLHEKLPALKQHRESKAVASYKDFNFDYRSLMACAWGKPSDAFGDLYKPFDNHRKLARLPGPPYHFMSRILTTEGKMGAMEVGSKITMEYDIPPDAWYFADNGHMPFAVLLEAALQPCGWLATYVGSALEETTDLKFRNLDGTGTLYQEILPSAGTLYTEVELTNISHAGSMIIESFKVTCYLGDTNVYTMDTVFGFFPSTAFEDQAGLPIPKKETEALTAISDYQQDLISRPARFFGDKLTLAGSQLCMLDRITGYWKTGGTAGKGRMRAEKDVNPDEWFFKAHFFQDPVQPGSLGIEAMLQLLQCYMLENNLQATIQNPHFEALMLDKPLTWKYRGQVIPLDSCITTLIDITETGEDEQGVYVLAEASLWIDGKRIYAAKHMGMRIREGG